MVKVITVNVNGLRSAAKKHLWDYLEIENADFICFQEIRASESDLLDSVKNPLGLHLLWHQAEKKGYSGVAIYSKTPPQKVQIGIGCPIIDREARYLRADFEPFSIVSLYLPSGTVSEQRQTFKYWCLDYFLPELKELIKLKKKFLIAGDWNIAHQNIDLKNWRANQKHSGFLPEERAWLSQVLQLGWVDVWRKLYPDVPGYTWWSNRGKAYEKDVGWRIDYQIASPELGALAQSAFVYKEKKFSDHAPLVVNYALEH
ncbi:MAG: exodeoxyribonuclease III [Neisseriaceae bacterium]